MRGLVGGTEWQGQNVCGRIYCISPRKMSFIPIEEHPLHCYQL